MNNKNLLPVALLVIIIIIAVGSFKFIFSGSTNSGGILGDSSTTDDSQISLSTNPNPPRLGQTTLIITVKDLGGKPVDNATVFFDLNMTTMNMGTQQGNATPQGNGQYEATGRLSMGGPWAVGTKVTMPSGEVINKDFTINVY